MKGQLNIEFVASILIFAILATYTAFFVYNLIPTFSDESAAETIRAKTYQISEMLLADPGIDTGNPPTSSWDRNNVKRVGLAFENEPYLLDYNKIFELNNTDPVKIRNGFYPEYNMKILIQNATDANLADVGNGEALTTATNIIRFAPVKMLDGSINNVRIILTVWRV